SAITRRPPPSRPLFPYTTLFRSSGVLSLCAVVDGAAVHLRSNRDYGPQPMRSIDCYPLLLMKSTHESSRNVVESGIDVQPQTASPPARGQHSGKPGRGRGRSGTGPVLGLAPAQGLGSRGRGSPARTRGPRRPP